MATNAASQESTSNAHLGDAPHNEELLEGSEDDGGAGPLLVNKLEVSCAGQTGQAV